MESPTSKTFENDFHLRKDSNGTTHIYKASLFGPGTEVGNIHVVAHGNVGVYDTCGELIDTVISKSGSDPMETVTSGKYLVDKFGTR